MERLSIKSLTLILLLSSCQIIEVTNNDYVESIPDLFEPINEENIEVNQAVENYGKRRWRRYQPSFHFDIDSSPDIVQTFCNDIF